MELGVDEGIKIVRAADSKRETKGFRKNRFTFLNSVGIKVRNNKSRPVNVRVFERIPFSPEKDLTVREVAIIPYPAKVSKSGLKRWDITLKPDEEKGVTYSYSITHPSDHQVASVEDTKVVRWEAK
jgi:hypothetical protein